MHKYWFRHRKFPCFGYTPISVEGWILTAILVGLIVILLYINNFGEGSEVSKKQIFNFVWQLSITVGLFCSIAESKTEQTFGEKIRKAIKRK
jgi:hypothetical protein